MDYVDVLLDNSIVTRHSTSLSAPGIVSKSSALPFDFDNDKPPRLPLQHEAMHATLKNSLFKCLVEYKLKLADKAPLQVPFAMNSELCRSV